MEIPDDLKTLEDEMTFDIGSQLADVGINPTSLRVTFLYTPGTMMLSMFTSLTIDGVEWAQWWEGLKDVPFELASNRSFFGFRDTVHRDRVNWVRDLANRTIFRDQPGI